MIRVKYKGDTYDIGFNRLTVKKLEDRGFDVDKVATMPVTMIPMFYNGAFEMKHGSLSKTTREEVWAAQRDKQGLVMALIDQYNAVVSSILEEPTIPEGEENPTPTWEVI